MRAVTLTLLRKRLREYVRLAASGEVILVTNRNRVVAELVAPRERRDAVVGDAVVARAPLAEGDGAFITPALLPPGTVPPRRPVATAAVLAAEIAGDRADR